MFKLVVVEGGCWESFGFIIRLADGEIHCYDVASLRRHWIMHDMCGVGVYTSRDGYNYYLPCFSKQTRYKYAVPAGQSVI